MVEGWVGRLVPESALVAGIEEEERCVLVKVRS